MGFEKRVKGLMTRVLSIDWDYFVEEDPMLDFGHREEMLFLTELWKWRQIGHKIVDGKLTEVTQKLDSLLPFRGNIGHILNLRCLRNDYNIGFSESHLAILKLLGDKTDLHIVNIDAHHDLGYAAKRLPIDEPNCGNWGEYLIQKGRVSSWTQIYPKWRIKFPEQLTNKPFSWVKKYTNFKVSTKLPSELILWNKVDYVFACRSGCWTPPVYDDLFNYMLAGLGANKGIDVRHLDGTGGKG